MVNTEYTLKEFRAPVECEVNDDEIKFHVDENGVLTLNGNVKSYSYDDDTVKIVLEDEVRAKIRINKTKKGTDIKINNVIFDISDENGGHITGQTQNGFVEIPGISLGKIYTLTEKVTPNNVQKNEGTFKFRLTRQGLTEINIEVLENSLLKGNCVLENSNNEISPIINVDVEDELRYSLNITKKDNDENNIPNVKFSVTESDTTVAIAQTDKAGKCYISKLELGKNYVLKELSAPGYYVDGQNDYINIKAERDESGKVKISQFDANGSMNLITEPTINENGLNIQLNILLENEKIPTYDLKIVKKNEEGLLLSNARFKLTRLFDGKEINVKTDENGVAVFTGLYENIEGKNVSGEYELKETLPPEGYRLSNIVLRFSATRDTNGKLSFKIIDGEKLINVQSESGEKEIDADDNLVTIGIMNKPIFTLIKTGKEGKLLPNAKFVITDIEGNPAKDIYGNFIGEYENGNYVVKTNAEGSISANIVCGLYKAVEIEAPEGYQLPTNLKDRTYYFGIGDTKDAVYSEENVNTTWNKENSDATVTSYKKLFKTIENGVIIYGEKTNSGVLIKNTPDGQVEWSKNISKISIEKFEIVDNTSYKIIAKYNGSEFEYDGHTIETVQDKDNYVIIKINNLGEFIEAHSFEAGENTRFIGKTEQGTLLIGNNNVVYEYNENGNAIGSKEFDYEVNAANGNGFLAVVKFDSETSISSDVNVTSGTYAIFYGQDGNYRWHKSLNNFYNDICVNVNNDNEFIVQGTYYVVAHGIVQFDKYIYLFDDSGEKNNCLKISFLQNGNAECKLNSYKDAMFSTDGNEYKNGFVISMKTGARSMYGVNLNTISLNGRTIYTFNTFSLTGLILGFDNDFNLKFVKNQYDNALDVEKIGNKYYSITNNRLFRYDGVEIMPQIADLTELNISNTLKKFSISTCANYYDRGTITGMGFLGYFNYGEDCEREIEIIPNEGYFISKVTINGEELILHPDEAGKVVLPAGYIKNITEDIVVYATFEENNNLIRIKKSDNLGNALSGAKFEIKNYEYQPNIGQFVENPKEYTVGEDTVTFSMIEENGYYKANNGNNNHTQAWGYLPLDLTECPGKYEITVEAQNVASNGEPSDGYIYINQSTDIPDVTVSTGRIATVSSSSSRKYVYTIDGGNNYYLHFGYVNRSSSVNKEFIIKSVNVQIVPEVYQGITNADGILLVRVNNEGKYVIKEIEAPDGYIMAKQSKEVTMTSESQNSVVEFVNEKKAKVIVHHYLEGTGEEYENEPVVLADKEIIDGKIGEKYTTAPNMEIDGYTLAKTQDGKYKIPENATDVFADEDIHVYYYYTPAPVKLTVHHYLEGTEDKLIDDVVTNYNKGEHYKTEVAEELLEAYEFIEVIGDTEKDITKDEEVIYYYAKKQHEITTKVETISYFGKPEKGGQISGEEQKPYEIVEHGDSNTKQIKMTPKEGFKIDQVVVNQSENGRKISSDEVDVTPNVDDTYELPQIQNVQNDYEVVVRYVPDMGKVIVHHYIEGTNIKLTLDNIIIDEYGNLIETKPLDENEAIGTGSFRRYILVRTPSQPNVIADREDQEVSYYYNVQYKITTEVIPHNEIIDGQNTDVKGGNISGENDKPYEVVMRGNNSDKVIKVTPDEGYKITKITINGETYDFSSRIAEDGTVTLENFINMTEDKHITVEYEKIKIPARVIVKYLEEGTNKVLKTEETKEGFVGDEYRTSRATIVGYEKAGEDPIDANGTMAENDIVIIYYYKKVQESVDPTIVDPENPEEPGQPENPEEPVNPDTTDVPEKTDTPAETGAQDITNNSATSEEQDTSITPDSIDEGKNERTSPQTGDNIVFVAIIGIIAIVVLFRIGQKK